MFTCPLTMETFRDPAITKYGQSYERAVLLEHLSKVRLCIPAPTGTITTAQLS